jgi:uncharacterized membrane protein
MSVFLSKLKRLLDEAVEQGVIDDPARDRLRELAEDGERSGGVLSLAAVLGWLGAAIVGIGVVLLVSANWEAIPALVKLVVFFLILAGVHGSGIYLRKQGRLIWFAEALNFLGAVLFLAGIGLISQIYHVDGRPPTAILLWLIAIAPLAWCFRSATISLLTLAALLTWLHMEQFGWVGRWYSVSFASSLMIEVGLGVALIGFAAALRDREPAIAWTFRGAGLLLLFYGVYMMGFFRHMSHRSNWQNVAGMIPPAAALLCGAIGLAVGFRYMLPNNRYLRDRLAILLVLLLGLGTAMLLSEADIIPEGPDLKFFNFGWYRTFHLTQWILSSAAWVLWFALALWCVLFASRTGRRAYLNAGVLAVGLGVITRFFDLAGRLFQSGLLFVVGGSVLLATCFAVEYWRRSIVRHLKDSDRLRTGDKR